MHLHCSEELFLSNLKHRQFKPGGSVTAFHPNPVTFFSRPNCPDYSNDEELCRNLKYFLQQLPQLNYGLLRFLCRFLASVAAFQQESWNTGALAAVFGPDIFQ